MPEPTPAAPPPVADGQPAGQEAAHLAASESRSRNAAVVLGAVVAAIALASFLGPILKPLMVAVFVYFATKAAAGFLIRRGVPAFLAYLVLFVCVSLAATALTVLAYGETMAFRAEWPRYQQRILSVIGSAPSEAGKPLAELFKASSHEAYKFVFERGLGLAELLIMAFFYLLFITLGAGKIPGRIRRAFPGPTGEHALDVGSKIVDGLEKFMKVKAVVSAGMGISAALILWAFGLRGWLLWGALFFVLNFITYIGSLAACVPPIVLAYLDLPGFGTATVLAALVVFNRFLWVDYVEIKMSGKHLGIDSVLLFLWLAYWGWMWGVVGLVLAFPMAAALKIVLENLDATKGWAVLMSEE